jgi:hypothetical protein
MENKETVGILGDIGVVLSAEAYLAKGKTWDMVKAQITIVRDSLTIIINSENGNLSDRAMDELNRLAMKGIINSINDVPISEDTEPTIMLIEIK